VSYDGPVHTDVVVLAEVQELPASELGAVVGDDGVWDPKAMDDVGEVSHPDFRDQNPGANIITRCAGTKSHTYDDSWHRIECHIFTT
jgi:hypothetical protein